jgi:hypothetical protein
MEFFERGRGTLLGGGLDVGASVIVRQIFPTLQTVGRPLAKAAMKSDVNDCQTTREAIPQIGEAGEDVDDGAAELVFEMLAEGFQKAAAGTGEFITSEVGRR